MTLTSDRKARYEQKIIKLESRLQNAENVLEKLLSNDGIESMKFDSGEANTWAKYSTPEQLQKLISYLESQIDWYRGKLNQTGIVRMRLARHGTCHAN